MQLKSIQAASYQRKMHISAPFCGPSANSRQGGTEPLSCLQGVQPLQMDFPLTHSNWKSCSQ